MKSVNHITAGHEEKIPFDLALWYPEQDMVLLTLEAIHEVKWPDLRSCSTFLSDTPLQVLRTLVPYSYLRGVFSTAEIVSLCRKDSKFRYVCAGNFPEFDEIRSFRRTNLDPLNVILRTVLTRIIRHTLNCTEMEFGNVSLFATEEASRRLQKAVKGDSIYMDY